MRLGDTVIDRGGLKGRVVANIDRDEFSAECPRAEWAYLTRGILVNTDEAGLVHYETRRRAVPHCKLIMSEMGWKAGVLSTKVRR